MCKVKFLTLDYAKIYMFFFSKSLIAMKHTLKITLLLTFLFFLSHFIGLFVVQYYLPAESSLPLGIEKPQFSEETSYLPIGIARLIATLLALVLVKFQAYRLWKLWFFLSILLTISIAFNAFLPQSLALALALLFAFLKIFKPHVLIHNLGELFIYGGLAALFVPVLNILSALILLVLISVYDMIAVWKTKHMLALAQFQSKNKVFAGLNVPYHLEVGRKVRGKKKKVSVEQAMLGGGDIGFTLLFSGVILKIYGFESALFVSLITTLSLLLLFVFAEKKKFYPAMPFLSAGCALGYLILLLF